jgi:predicted ribosomally synthesized peptide with nif11-like leader
MSIESAKDFYQKITTDETFRTQLQNTASEERIALIQAAGYDFTPEEWEAASAEISESSNHELSDAELTEVSGGFRFPMPFIGTKYGVPNLWDLRKNDHK